MKHVYLFILILCGSAISKAVDLRYLSPIFSEVDVTTDVEYAKAMHLNSILGTYNSGTFSPFTYEIHEGEETVEERPLYMDIYMPKGDTLSKRPLVILAHPGGFITGVRNDLEMTTWCEVLAKAGYVTATIDYRLGMAAEVTWMKNPFTQEKILPSIVNINPVNARRAVYRGVQDGRAAIRFMKSNADLYGIDTTRVYMVGSSAGGFIAVQNQYYRSAADMPEGVLDAPSLGGLNEVGVLGFGSIADAYINLWGAIQHTDLIDNSDAPALLVHGTNDNVVPFKDGYSLKGLIPAIPLITINYNVDVSYGSYCIDTAMTARGIEHETYFVEGAGHGFYGDSEGNPNAYVDTIMPMALTFLHKQHKPTAGFSYSVNQATAGFTSQVGDEVVAVAWDFGDGTQMLGANPEHTYAANGTYTVIQVVYNNIASPDTAMATVTIDFDTAVEDIWAGNLKVYPNPAQNQFAISGDFTNAAVTIHDLSGKVVYQNANVQSEQALSASGLPKGLYLVQIKVDGHRSTQKLIVE